jgi:hypothetical protein
MTSDADNHSGSALISAPASDSGSDLPCAGVTAAWEVRIASHSEIAVAAAARSALPFQAATTTRRSSPAWEGTSVDRATSP